MSDLVDKENTCERVYSDAEIQTKLATDLPHWFMRAAGYAVNIKPVDGKRP